MEKDSGLPSGRPLIDSDDGDPDKRKRKKEINAKRNGDFLIDSVALRFAKARFCGNIICKVERFEHGTDLIFKDLINQMMTNFTIGPAPSNHLSA